MKDNEKFIKSWGKKREKGKTWYVLLKCLILGITLLLAFTTIKFLNVGRVQFDFLYFAFGFVGAMIVASCGWDTNEEKYYDIISKKL